MKSNIVFFSVIFLVFSSCESDDTGQPGNTGEIDPSLLMVCNMQDEPGSTEPGTCQEWRGDVEDESNSSVNFPAVCSALLKGQLLLTGCPTEEIATCETIPSAAARTILRFYYSSDFDSASAQADCDGRGGTFDVI